MFATINYSSLTSVAYITPPLETCWVLDETTTGRGWQCCDNMVGKRGREGRRAYTENGLYSIDLIMAMAYKEYAMKIFNVIEIYDNGEFITIVTQTGSAIHLPMNSQHSIVIQSVDNPSDDYAIIVNIDLYQD